jgi:tetratricopeptide (TPR) repeat protein
VTQPSVDFLFQEAMLRHRQGAIADAVASYTRILRQHPRHVDTLCLLGMAHGQLGQWNDAVDVLRKAVKAAPRHAPAHHLLATAMRDSGNTDQAIKSFNRAITCQSDFVDAYVGLADVLRMLGRTQDVVSVYDRLVAAKPASFEAWFKHAAALEAAGHRDRALTSYDRAIALKPDLAEAHANAGNILAALGRHEDSVARYDRAIAARKDFVEVHVNRGNSLRLLGRLEEAAAAYDAAVAIRPTMAQAHFSRGLAAEDCDRFAEAIESFDRAISLNPDVRLQAHALAHRAWACNALGDFEHAFADVERSLRLAPNDDDALFRASVIELLHGRWNEAWPKYERRLSLLPEWSSFVPPPCPRWTGEDLAGGTLLLRGEQGLGDRIQFCSFVPHLARRGLRVAVWTDRVLLPLLRTCDGLEAAVSDPATLAHDGNMRWLPMGSLPLVLSVMPDTIPASPRYLRAEPARVQKWREHLGPEGFKIGIAWQGNAEMAMDKTRSIPLREFAPLAELPGVRMVVLQKGAGIEQVADAPFKERLETFGDDFDAEAAFLDTAAVMMHLDLVVTSDTSIAHLAGALGREVFVALRKIPDWRFLLGRDDSPWYPSMRLFRQAEAGNWRGVFERIAQVVREQTGAAH